METNDPRFQRVFVMYNRVRRSPGWVTKLSILAAVLVVAVPVALLSLAALIIGLVAFLVLSTVASVGLFFRGGWRAMFSREKRKNVRVVNRPGDRMG